MIMSAREIDLAKKPLSASDKLLLLAAKFHYGCFLCRCRAESRATRVLYRERRNEASVTGEKMRGGGWKESLAGEAWPTMARDRCGADLMSRI